MQILFLTTRLPYPVIGGDKLRVYHFLKELKALGHEITLISLYDKEEDLKKAKLNNDFCSKLVPIKFNKKIAYIKASKAILTKNPFTVEYFYDSKMQKAVDEELQNGNYDLIFCHLIRTAPYVEKYKNIKKIIDFTDAISFSYSRRLHLNRSFYDKFKIGIEFRKILNFEIKCIKSFDKVFVIANLDRQFLLKYNASDNIEILPNGVDSDYFKNKTEHFNSNSIIFVGNMRTIANSDAAVYFGQKIFPKIKQVNPNAEFNIIGAYPRHELFAVANKIQGINIIGRVEDVRDSMKNACVSVCSVRIAAGVQNKILESMSMGIPVVTTPEGAEGIDASEEDILIARSDEEMANSVLDLMNNPQKRELYSKNSRKFVVEKYSWQNETIILNDILQKIVDDNPLKIGEKC